MFSFSDQACQFFRSRVSSKAVSHRWPKVILCATSVLTFLCHSARAEDRTWSASAYWTKLNYPGIWKSIPFDWRNSQMVGFGLKHRMATLGDTPVLGSFFAGTRIEAEFLLGQHYGLSRHQEIAAVLMARTRDFSPINGMLFNFAVGGGFSYATSRPALESSITGRSARFLDYMRVETEITPVAAPALHLVFLLHHRSTLGGTFGPKYAGSNMFGFGIRADF